MRGLQDRVSHRIASHTCHSRDEIHYSMRGRAFVLLLNATLAVNESNYGTLPLLLLLILTFVVLSNFSGPGFRWTYVRT